MRIDGFFKKRLLRYLAGLVPAQDESLAEHDAQYHPDGYEDGGSCKFREEREKGDKADVGVGEAPDGKVTPEEDAAYLDAVKRPDADKRTCRLAPNGKRSNLTNAQYWLVRTKRFKDWFGDWGKQGH